MSELDGIYDELRSVTQRLDATSTDHDERVRLEDRRRELHALARSLADRVGIDRLRDEEQRLLRLIDAQEGTRVSVSSLGPGGGEGGGGIDPLQLMELNRRIADGVGLPALHERLRDVRRRIAEVEDGADDA